LIISATSRASFPIRLGRCGSTDGPSVSLLAASLPVRCRVPSGFHRQTERRIVVAALPQDHPGGARQLVGQGDHHGVAVRPLLEPREPSTQAGVPFTVEVQPRRLGADYQQATQVCTGPG